MRQFRRSVARVISVLIIVLGLLLVAINVWGFLSVAADDTDAAGVWPALRVVAIGVFGVWAMTSSASIRWHEPVPRPGWLPLPAS